MPAPPVRGAAHSSGAAATDLSSVLVDILDCTLWQRQLGAISEEIVAALVCQVGTPAQLLVAARACGAHMRRLLSGGACCGAHSSAAAADCWPGWLQLAWQHAACCKPSNSAKAQVWPPHDLLLLSARSLQVFEGIRDNIVQAAELKFNCFFLMPLVDTFPAKLRSELECAYEEDVEEVFDVAAVRRCQGRGAAHALQHHIAADVPEVWTLSRVVGPRHDWL